MDTETQRHNVATENISVAQLNLGERTLQETIRHNTVSENVSYLTLQEAKRHNIASEGISYANLNETTRHNVVSEGISDKATNSQIKVNDSVISKNEAETKFTGLKSEQQKQFNYMTDLDALYYAEDRYSKSVNERAEANYNVKRESWYSFGQYLNLIGSILPTSAKVVN
jgi:hypothetical protein